MNYIQNTLKNNSKYKIVYNGIIMTPECAIKDGEVLIKQGKIIDVGKRGISKECIEAIKINAKGIILPQGWSTSMLMVQWVLILPMLIKPLSRRSESFLLNTV